MNPAPKVDYPQIVGTGEDGKEHWNITIVRTNKDHLHLPEDDPVYMLKREEWLKLSDSRTVQLYARYDKGAPEFYVGDLPIRVAEKAFPRLRKARHGIGLSEREVVRFTIQSGFPASLEVLVNHVRRYTEESFDPLNKVDFPARVQTPGFFRTSLEDVATELGVGSVAVQAQEWVERRLNQEHRFQDDDGKDLIGWSAPIEDLRAIYEVYGQNASSSDDIGRATKEFILESGKTATLIAWNFGEIVNEVDLHEFQKQCADFNEIVSQSYHARLEAHILKS